MSTEEDQTINEVNDIIIRNTAIAELLNFKLYIPNHSTLEEHKKLYRTNVLRWYVIPGVGKYCNAELRFHCDYNWLISASLEFCSKYKNSNKVGELKNLYDRFSNIKIENLDKKELWIKLSDYALELLKQKNGNVR